MNFVADSRVVAFLSKFIPLSSLRYSFIRLACVSCLLPPVVGHRILSVLALLRSHPLCVRVIVIIIVIVIIVIVPRSWGYRRFHCGLTTVIRCTVFDSSGILEATAQRGLQTVPRQKRRFMVWGVSEGLVESIYAQLCSLFFVGDREASASLGHLPMLRSLRRPIPRRCQVRSIIGALDSAGRQFETSPFK